MFALLPYPRKLPPSPLILVLPCPLQDKQGAADPPRCCTKNPLRVAPVFYTCFMGALPGALIGALPRHPYYLRCNVKGNPPFCAYCFVWVLVAILPVSFTPPTCYPAWGFARVPTLPACLFAFSRRRKVCLCASLGTLWPTGWHFGINCFAPRICPPPRNGFRRSPAGACSPYFMGAA